VPTAQSGRKSSGFHSIGFSAGNRYAQFLMQNSFTAIGDAMPGGKFATFAAATVSALASLSGTLLIEIS
jgi:hypothetical protein